MVETEYLYTAKNSNVFHWKIIIIVILIINYHSDNNYLQ